MCKFAPKSELKVAQGRLLRILLVQTHLYAYASGHYERVHGKRVVLMNQKKKGVALKPSAFYPLRVLGELATLLLYTRLCT